MTWGDVIELLQLRIYAPKHALMLAGQHNPDLLDEYVRIETAIGHNFHGEPGASGSFSIASVRDALQTGDTIEIEGWGNS